MGNPGTESAGTLLAAASIARQPILDATGKVAAYSLLSPSAAGSADNDISAFLDELVLHGIEKLAPGVPAFIFCTPEALIRDWVSVLPPQSTILSLPATVEATPELLTAARTLHQAGFRLALRDARTARLPEPLLELASYVKFDISRVPAPEPIQRQIEGSRASLVAEGVNSPEKFHYAAAQGLEYFQGTYFCHPEPVAQSRVPVNRIFQAQLLHQLQQPELNLNKITPLIRRDPSLVLRLLRLVNSPVCAVRQEVRSVETAIMLLGERTFRQMINLSLLHEMNGDGPAELLHAALIRARFCELAAPLAGLDPQEQYLVGLLSLLPAMLKTTMDKLIGELPLANGSRQALLGEAILERAPLTWLEHHELYEVSECGKVADTFHLNEQRLHQFYVDALMWEAATPRNLP